MEANFLSGQFICGYLHEMAIFAFPGQACSHRDVWITNAWKTTPSTL